MLSEKQTSEPFESHENLSYKSKMRVGSILSCDHSSPILLGFCVHSLVKLDSLYNDKNITPNVMALAACLV